MFYVMSSLQKELLRELLINGRDLHDEGDCREGYMRKACPGMGLPCSEYTRGQANLIADVIGIRQEDQEIIEQALTYEIQVEDAIRLLLEHMQEYD